MLFLNDLRGKNEMTLAQRTVEGAQFLIFLYLSRNKSSIMKTLPLLLIFAFSINLVAQDRHIEFRDLSFSEALEASAQENKPIFMDCYTTWCGPCKWMAANIFTENEVADFYNENFVCVKFDMEKGEGLEIAKEFEIRAYPTLLFVNADRQLVMKQIGAPRETKPYISLGQNAKSDTYNLIALAENVDENRNDASYMAKYFTVMAAADMVDQEEVEQYFSRIPKEEWLSAENVEIMSSIEHDIESPIFQDLVDRSDDYIAVDSTLKEVIGYSIVSALLNEATSRKETAEEDYSALLNKVKSWEFPGKGPALFMVESRVAQRQGSEAYIEYCLEKVKPNVWDNANELNSVAWYFFKNTDEPEHLISAEKWAERAVTLEPSHHILDTYANLLFKNGKNEKALKIGKQALDVAQAEGADTQAYEELIATIKEEM